MEIPATSVTLLKDLAGGSAASRWTEFYRRYEPAMRAYLATRYPSVEADDAIQEAMVALMGALPEYRYTPDRCGHFRNYLMGIVKHKALDAMRRAVSRRALESEMEAQEKERMLAPQPAASDCEDEAWRISAMEAALDQLFADDTILPSTREVFRHIVQMHEPPDDIARQFGITRNNVDQIKSRMIARLSRLVAAMTA